MIKILKYILIPLAVFVIGLFLFFELINQGESKRTADMPEAALPVVYVLQDGERINEMHGYTMDMDVSSMGDTVSPLSDDGVLTISIDSFGGNITQVEFEVLSSDGADILQSSDAENLNVSDGVATADLTIREIPEEQEEYLLVLEVTSSGEQSQFYTRIALDNGYVDDSIEFVRYFHEVTLSEDRQDELAVYMETTYGANNSTLQTATLKNTLTQVCWGEMQGEDVTEPVVSVLDIGEDYHALNLSSLVSITDEEGNEEYYSVQEYFRVRKGEARMYVLEYERTVEEIYLGEIGELPTEELNLGIRSSDVAYKANETGNVICFVQNGELWSYNMGSGVLTLIFSFISDDSIDVRELYDEHDIRIIRVDETGSVDFVVCGYMNRGEHEGQVGISVCHFDSTTTSAEELVFLPYSHSYSMLSSEIGQAMYITDSGEFCLAVGGKVYGVDLEEREYFVKIYDMTEGNYVCSDDGRYLAWTEGEASEATEIHLIDLESGRTGDISAPDGWRIRPLGFMGSDCVYGLAKESDIPSKEDDQSEDDVPSEEDDRSDEDIFPMRSVRVVDFSDSDLDVLKTYDVEDVFVTGAELREGNIYLEQMTLENGEFVEAEEYVIYNRDMQDTSSIYVIENYSDIKETEVALQLPQEILSEPELLADTKWIITEETELRISQ